MNLKFSLENVRTTASGNIVSASPIYREEIPFRMTIVGPSNSGKSFLVHNYVLDNSSSSSDSNPFFIDYEFVRYFSGSMEKDSDVEVEDYSRLLNGLTKSEQKKIQKDTGGDLGIICFDDPPITDKFYKKIIESYYQKGRHANLCVIGVFHTPMVEYISPMVADNTSIWVIFPKSLESHRQRVSVMTGISKERFLGEENILFYVVTDGDVITFYEEENQPLYTKKELEKDF